MTTTHLEEKFGSPPHTVEEWLRIYIEDTERYRQVRLTPWGRAESRGRISGLQSALELIERLRYPNGFPITLYPTNYPK